jgi:hypothetical protein
MRGLVGEGVEALGADRVGYLRGRGADDRAIDLCLEVVLQTRAVDGRVDDGLGRAGLEAQLRARFRRRHRAPITSRVET